MKTHDYSVLARLGAPRRTRVGDVPGYGSIIPSLFSAAGEVVERGVEYKQEKDRTEAAQAKSTASLKDAVAADRAATDAVYQALVSAETKSPSAASDLLAAQQATAAQDVAASGLSPDNQKKRADAARDAVKSATADWQKMSSSGDKSRARAAELRVQAARTTYGKTQNQLLIQSAAAPGGSPKAYVEESWFTRPVIGPVPGWGVATGALALLGTAVTLVLRRGV